jgi:class 3 adenylate cyclase
MRFPSAEFDDAVAAACHGTIGDELLAELLLLLRQDEAARDEYLLRTAIHSRLASLMPSISTAVDHGANRRDGDVGGVSHRKIGAAPWQVASLVAGLVCLMLASIFSLSVMQMRRDGAFERASVPPAIVARFGSIDAAKWVAANVRYQAGDPIMAGQRLELSAGTLPINFTSGAAITLVGPAIFDARSGLEGELILGRVQVVASSPESKGFTIQTRTARFVDLGTVFMTEADPDGQCRVGVASGEVMVHVAGSPNGSRLRQGELMTIEPGSPRVTVRIERGEGTPDFRFATIDPPSSKDYADVSRGLSSVSLIGGPLVTSKFGPAFSSGGVDRLVDGTAQGSADAPSESVFFRGRATFGGFLFDLGKPVAISKINSYSWHESVFRTENHVRATQKYTVWGFMGDDPPDPTRPSSGNGWQRIARIDTDNFFDVVAPLDRPAQQACSISSETGSLGRYRFLLFEVFPTIDPHDGDVDHTFYGEIDIYADADKPRPITPQEKP